MRSLAHRAVELNGEFHDGLDGMAIARDVPAYTIAVGNPAPEGFLASANRIGVDPEEMYMVGDDLNNDVLAAQVVGMAGVLVRTGKFRQDTLDRWAADEFAMQPNYVVDSVADLPALLGL